MLTKHTPNMDALFLENALEHYRPHISPEGLCTCERIEEIMMMCARDNPVYEQISSFAVALYTLGHFDCPDLLSVYDVDPVQAGEILQKHFTRIRAEDLPGSYSITESSEQYLLVAGDPLFPAHFAVLTDCASQRPFFSKLPFFGSGFDSLDELVGEFAGTDGVSKDDFHYFRKDPGHGISSESLGRIYVLK